MMLELKAEKRDIFGKKLEAFRKKGRLPAVFYGPKEEATPIFISSKDFKKIWKEMGESGVIRINLGNPKKEALIHEVALDPKKDEPIHVDFYTVLMDKLIQAVVPLEFSGVSPAVGDLGAVLVKVMREIEIEALPKNLPQELTADISKLAGFEDKILAKDIFLPLGVELKTNPEEVVAIVEAPKEEVQAPAEGRIAFEEIEVAGEKEKEKEGEEAEKE